MNELYAGERNQENIDKAIMELIDINAKLANLKPNEVIWDIEILN